MYHCEMIHKMNPRYFSHPFLKDSFKTRLKCRLKKKSFWCQLNAVSLNNLVAVSHFSTFTLILRHVIWRWNKIPFICISIRIHKKNKKKNKRFRQWKEGKVFDAKLEEKNQFPLKHILYFSRIVRVDVKRRRKSSKKKKDDYLCWNETCS